VLRNGNHQDVTEVLWELAARTSSESASEVGILQALLQTMLQGAGPIGYCLKVLKGIISAGCCARCLVGVLFLDPRSLILYLLLVGHFVPRSWILYLFLTGVLFLGPRSVPGIAGSWALRAHGRCWLLASLALFRFTRQTLHWPNLPLRPPNPGQIFVRAPRLNS
jgi:hypothetical protein